MCVIDDVLSKFPNFVILHNFPVVLWDTKSDRSIRIFLVDGESRVVIFVIVSDIIFGV